MPQLRLATFDGKMQIDVNEVTEGVAAATHRSRQRIGHVEKTSVQKSEIAVKHNGTTIMGCTTARASNKN